MAVTLDPHLLRDAAEVRSNLRDAVHLFAGKRILLTGGAGFLGAHFVHFFVALNDAGVLAEPCQLTAWDNFTRGIPEWIRLLECRPDVSFEQRDICQPQEIGPVDMIVHAASIASPTFYRRHPIETMDANVVGLRLLLDHCLTREIESFLFFSTSEIYGDPVASAIPTPESYRGNVSCTGPRACYDESKRYGETLCVNFSAVHNVPVKIVRPFNNFGPGLKISDRRVIPDLFRDVLANRNPVLLSDGRATRTFCYISDAMSGYLLALLSPHDGESFNVGTDEPEISMRELTDQIIKVSGKSFTPEFGRSEDVNYLIDNPNRRCPDLSKSRRMLGYNPVVPLDVGLERTYRYYLDHRSGEDL